MKTIIHWAKFAQSGHTAARKKKSNYVFLEPLIEAKLLLVIIGATIALSRNWGNES
jgi:hypothetical protein